MTPCCEHPNPDECPNHGRAAGQPITDDDDQLLDRLEDAIGHIIAVDLPGLPELQRRTLAGHLTGAVYVTVRGFHPDRVQTQEEQ